MNFPFFQPKQRQNNNTLIKELTKKVLWLSSMGLLSFGAILILIKIITLQTVKQELENSSVIAINHLESFLIQLENRLIKAGNS